MLRLSAGHQVEGKAYGVSHGISRIHWRDGAGWAERLVFTAKIGLYFLDIHV